MQVDPAVGEYFCARNGTVVGVSSRDRYSLDSGAAAVWDPEGRPHRHSAQRPGPPLLPVGAPARHAAAPLLRWANLAAVCAGVPPARWSPLQSAACHRGEHRDGRAQPVS